MTGADLRPVFADAQAAFGVPATVTRPAPADAPIATTVIWILPSAPAWPAGESFERREPLRMLALSRDEVPAVPRGTVIVAPERLGETPKSWIVDSHEYVDADQTRVFVVETL